MSKSAGRAVPRGPNKYGSIPLARGATRSALCYDTQISGAEPPENQKKPGGRFGHRASEFREGVEFTDPHFDRFALAAFTSADFHLMDLRQYSVFGQAQGVCG